MATRERIFPLEKDFQAHQAASRALSRHKKDAERRATTLSTPEEVSRYLLEEVRFYYRRGQNVIRLECLVPLTNFTNWGAATRLLRKDDAEPHVRELIRHSVVKAVREQLRQMKEQAELGKRVTYDINGSTEASHLKITARFTVPTTRLGMWNPDK